MTKLKKKKKNDKIKISKEKIIKINNKRLYTADIYRLNDYRQEVTFADIMGCEVGHYDFTEEQKTNKTVMVKVGCMYVPVKYITGLLSYWNILDHERKGESVYRPDYRFYDELSALNEGGYCRIKNLKPLKPTKGKTSLKELREIDYQNYMNNPLQQVMEIID